MKSVALKKYIPTLTAILALVCATAVFAQPELISSPGLEAKLAGRSAGTEAYVVQLRDDPVAAYKGTVHGLAATVPLKGKKLDPKSGPVRAYVKHLRSRHDDVLSSVGALDQKIYDYQYAFNGFAAYLTPEQVEGVEQHVEVVRVWENELRQLQTDTSPDFLGLSGQHGPWFYGAVGEDVVIAAIDTGIWPEHPSFADVPTPWRGESGHEIPYGPPPAGWTGDECDFGNTAFNPDDAPFACNGKLLAARTYVSSFSTPGTQDGAYVLPEEYLSARDQDGHGSHTGATAGGNYGVPASIDGLGDLGEVSGMAPRARIAAYKVCWNGTAPPAPYDAGCGTLDSMAAIDQAVADGVDVINFSIGGSGTNFNGPEDVAFLFAADAGVFVATAAGNAGPNPQTMGTPAAVPWVTGVGGSQDDQIFAPGIEVTAPAAVAGLYDEREGNISVPLADTGPVSGDLVVASPLDGCTAIDPIDGIALVQRGSCAFSDKHLNAQAAGADAIVVFNNAGDSIITMGGDPTGITIPGVMIIQSDGELLAATPGVQVTLDADIRIPKVNSVGGFSSRGPNAGAPDIIKPDITAPGVQILAAQTPTPNEGQTPGQLFQIGSGTSMASPHIAGIAAVLKQAYPDWTPAMIRSAMMTSARQDVKKSYGNAAADPFDMGAGHVVARDAFLPGLVYDVGLFEYVSFTCGVENQPPIFSQAVCDALGAIDSSDLNLPSIGIAELVGVQTVTRRVTRPELLGGSQWFNVSVEPPPGVEVTVSPSTIQIKKGETQSFDVTFTTTGDAVFGEWAFGSLTWQRFPNHESVRIPLAVRPVAFAGPDEVAVAEAGAAGSLSYDVGLGYSGDFFADALGLVPAQTQAGSVPNGGATLHFVYVPPGTRYARFSLFDEFVGSGAGEDDLDLQVQGPNTQGYPLVGFSGSASSNEEINAVDPLPGFYAVFVIHYASVADPTPYALFSWGFGPDQGNMTITAPSPVANGTTEPINVDWTGLSPATKYRGGVVHRNAGGELGLTVLSIDTN
ncbi:MAG: S8 family serine peptidase [bacterium]|nr:S8 family serine peptidase [bacterium]